MFFNELKVLVLMRSGSRRADPDADADRRSSMRGLGMGGCGWPPFDCSSRDDEEEYYGTDPRPRSLAFEEKEARLQGGLDAVSLTSSMESGIRSPQCRICFQGPEQVNSLLRLFTLLLTPVLRDLGSCAYLCCPHFHDQLLCLIWYFCVHATNTLENPSSLSEHRLAYTLFVLL